MRCRNILEKGNEYVVVFLVSSAITSIRIPLHTCQITFCIRPFKTFGTDHKQITLTDIVLY